MTQTHIAQPLANSIEDEIVKGMHKVGSSTDCAAAILRQQHALIVQMWTAFEYDRFIHDDQREAIATVNKYLEAKT